MSERVIVAHDGSGPSTAAVQWAAAEAEARHASLRVVTCSGPSTSAAPLPAIPATRPVDSLLEPARAMVDDVGHRIISLYPNLIVTTEVSIGPASLTVADQAQPTDLVVVGAGSHDGTTALWLGGTPRALVRMCPCPVVVVRSTASSHPPARVVVGVDGSATSGRALRWAAMEADRHRVDLVVVHGWWYPYPATSDVSLRARELTEMDAACVLDEALERARRECGGSIAGRLVASGAVPAVLGTAREDDLIVVGSSGRGAILSGVFGSTVNSLLDLAASPLVVVPGAPRRP